MSLRAYFRTIRKGRLAAAGGVVLAVVLLIVLLVVNNTSTPPKKKSAGGGPRVHLAAPRDGRLVLDGPARPGRKIPDREPIAVKIGNEPDGARPQSGLNEADVVYGTPAEGGIMRYIAIYQCQNASNIGPIRSVRWVDWHILQEFPHAVLAFVGGVTPNQQTVASLPFIDDANEPHLRRVPPGHSASCPTDRLEHGCAAALFPKQSAPPPIFRYSASLPKTANPALFLVINFSYGTDVVWKWDASTGQWVHTYSGHNPHLRADASR